MWYLAFGVGLFALGLVAGLLFARRNHNKLVKWEADLKQYEDRLRKIQAELKG